MGGSEAHRQLRLIAAVQVLAMATWFSASAVVPALRREWGVGTGSATLLTVAVQLGFLVGALTLGSALPQLLNSVAALPWRGVLLVAAGCAVVASVVAWSAVRPGPLARPAPPLAPSFVLTVFRDRGP